MFVLRQPSRSLSFNCIMNIYPSFENRTSKQVTDTQWWRHQMETFSALLAICARNHWSPVNSPHKGQWREALMFSLIYTRINGWVNNSEAGDLRRHRAHYAVTVMLAVQYVQIIMHMVREITNDHIKCIHKRSKCVTSGLSNLPICIDDPKGV